MTQFNFTRTPSVKVAVSTEITGLVQADNELVLIGKRGATGGTAVTGTPIQIENYGDPVAVQAECDTLFGASAEISEMIVAAVKANFYGGKSAKAFPPIKAISMANDATSSDLAAALSAHIGMPMAFAAVSFPMTDATARAAFKAHLEAISASDRGLNSQFGSFGVMATDGDLSTATTAGVSGAGVTMMYPWLRDSAGTKANKVHQVAAAYAAICASNGVPFLPLNDVKVGGLVAPVAASDWHTSGDAGSVSLGLDSGLVPLTVSFDGSVLISRSITALRTLPGQPDASYFDMQDWQSLYYFRKNAYTTAKQPRYSIAKATDAKLKALGSELIALAKQFEQLEIFQYVDKLVQDFVVARSLTNRSAAVYTIPVNVVPGFHNKGIDTIGTTKYDSFIL